MSNAELFGRMMVAGAGFTAGAIAIVCVGLVLIAIIGIIAQEDKHGN